MWSCPAISSRSIFLMSIALQAYTIYARTNGMRKLTYVMVLRVNSLLQLLAIVRLLCKSAFDG